MNDGLKDKYRLELINILSRCKRVEKALLFGSRAMGTFTTTSDVDIVLYGDDLTLDDQARLEEQIEELTMPQSVDLVLYRTIESEELLNHIKRYGVQWWPKKAEKVEGWEERTLGDIADIEMGQSPKGSTCNKIGKGMPLLNGPTEFGSHHPCPVQFTTNPQRNAVLGDLLFCVRGSVGRMNWADKEYAIGRGLAAIRHKYGSDYQPFIRGLVEYYLPILLLSASGSVFPNVSRNQLTKLNINLPPLAEQKAIAHVLGSLDDKIKLNRRMNETLEAMAQALFKSWFVDFDPVIDNALVAGNEIPEALEARAEIRRDALEGKYGSLEAAGNSSCFKLHHSHFPSTFTHSDEMGLACAKQGAAGRWIPEGWRVVAFEKLITFIVDNRGKTPPLSTDSEKVYPLVEVNALKGENRFFDKYAIRKYVDQNTYNNWFRKGHPQEGDVMLSTVGSIAEVCLANDEKCCIAQNIISLRGANSLCGFYLYELLKYYKDSLINLDISSVQPSIKIPHLMNMKVLDGHNLHDKFGNLVKDYSERYKSNQKQLTALSNLRDTLLPKLLSGEVRIPEAEKMVEGVK